MHVTFLYGIHVCQTIVIDSLPATKENIFCPFDIRNSLHFTVFRQLYCIMSNICFSATTHTDLVLRAKEKGLEYRVVHNASIMNAVGCCGLQVTES